MEERNLFLEEANTYFEKNDYKSTIENTERNIERKNALHLENLLEKSTTILNKFAQQDTERVNIREYFTDIIRIMWSLFYIAFISLLVTVLLSVCILSFYNVSRWDVRDFFNDLIANQKKSNKNSKSIEYDYIPSEDGSMLIKTPRIKRNKVATLKNDKVVVFDSLSQDKQYEPVVSDTTK